MTTKEFINKYPDVEGDPNIISLERLGDIVSIVTKLRQDKDYDSINMLGLSDFLSDMRKTLGTSKEYIYAKREDKLKRILK